MGKTYHVSFDLNGGTSETTIESILHGDTIPETVPIKDDYKFGGWYTKDGSDDDWGEQYTAYMVLTDDITVYAKWNTVSITFDKNGGTTNAKPNITAGGDELPATNPARIGYKFVGWYTKNGSDGDWGKEYNEYYVVIDDMTVYAKWNASGYDCTSDITLTALAGSGTNAKESYTMLTDGKKQRVITVSGFYPMPQTHM